MHKKITKTLLLLTLLVLLIGITSAATVSENTTTNKVAKDTNTASHLEVEKSNEKVVEKKIIKKENNNKTVKTASKTVNVNDFNTLHDTLTSDAYDTVTVNINSDIKQSSKTVLNSAIKTLKINGNGNTIDMDENSRFLTINSGKVTFNNVVIKNCLGNDAILNYGDLTINNCSIINNSGYYGIINNYDSKANLIVTDSNFYNNKAAVGGAIYNEGKLKITKSSFNNNRAISAGGVIYNTGNLTLSDSIFNNNYAVAGGSIRGYISVANIFNCSFNNNTANSGGAISTLYDDLNINQCTFTNNIANNGGAITTNVSDVNITYSIFDKNYAGSCGGAIETTNTEDYYNDRIKIDNNIFTNNEATYGGALYLEGIYNNITNNNFQKNNATIGGAIFNRRDYTNITNNNFIENSVTRRELNGSKLWIEEFILKGEGGAIANGAMVYLPTTISGENTYLPTPYTVSNARIIENNFTNNSGEIGGAISIFGGSNTEIRKNIFTSNKASKDGAAIYDNNHKEVRYEYSANGSPLGEKEVIYGLNQEIINNTFKNNKANSTGKAIIVKGTATLNNNLNYQTSGASSTIYTNTSEALIINNIFEDTIPTTTTINVNNNTIGNIRITGTVKDKYGNNVNEGTLFITSNNKKISTTTIKNGAYNVLCNITSKGKYTLKAEYMGTTNYYPSNSTTQTINVVQKILTIKLNPVKGVIGETITLKATLTDTNNNSINGGNLAFKLNGKTLRSDGRFDSSAPAMKFSVKNGLVTYTIKADLYLRNAKNLTASYSGTSTYQETTSPSVTAQIQKRNAQVTVTTTPTRAKQYETLTFKITAKDVTKNGKNNTLIYTDTKVMLKVNGVTLKDGKGKPVYVTLDKNAQATYKYTIPAGTGGITASKAARNYKVEAIFVGDNYYPGARNSTSFQVERSPTNVNIRGLGISYGKLNIDATLKDYKGNYLIGTNKVTVKINGKSYTRNGKPVYWSVKNGVVDISLEVDPNTTIKRVMLVTGERQAYLEGRSERTIS